MKFGLSLFLLCVVLPLYGCGAQVPSPGDDDDDDSGGGELFPELDCPEDAGVFDSTVSLANDDEVAEFLASYNEVTGNFGLEGAAITAAPNLGCIRSVGGEVAIKNTRLEAIDLRSLETVDLSFHLADNQVLRAIAAPNLSSVGLFSVINDNDLLESIDLSGLELARLSPPTGEDSTHYAFQAEKNWALTELKLDSLVRTQGDFDLNDNDLLVEVRLPSLTHAQGDFRIDNLDSLQLLDAPLLEEVFGEFRFDHNGATYSLLSEPPSNPMTLHLESLRRILGRFYFDNNPSVVASDFPVLREVGEEFFFRGSIALPSVDFEELRLVIGDFYFSEAYTIELVNLESLTNVGGNMTVEFTRLAQSLSAEILEDVGGNLQITQNEGLSSLSFDGLTSVGGDLEVQFNGALADSEVCQLKAQLGEGLTGSFLSNASCSP